MLNSAVDFRSKRILLLLVGIAFVYWIVFLRPTRRHVVVRHGQQQAKDVAKKLDDPHVHKHLHDAKDLEEDLSIARKKVESLRSDLKDKEFELENERKKRGRLEEQLQQKNTKVKTPPETVHMFDGQRLVHFDMKGAPPKLEYLTNLLPLLKRNGVTGLLMEYEDMFPFTGKLKVIRAPDAYTIEELKKFIQDARNDQLLVIPLVQTFGHLEFVLKHEDFKKVRLNPELTDSISHDDPESFTLITEMLKQVIDLHSPGLKLIHVGGDEIWSLKNRSDSAEIYMKHMVPILKYVRHSDGLQPIIWEDMFRKWSADQIQPISELAEPMIWNYRPTLNIESSTWENYKKAFKNIWIASAFKGAERPNADFVNIHNRVQNHLAWLKMLPNLKPMVVQGFALTGWSRFNHHGTFCELFPSSIPSLITCLKVIKDGECNENTASYVTKELGFETTLDIDSDVVYESKPHMEPGTFPGHEVYHTVQKYLFAHNRLVRLKTLLASWGSSYQRKRNGRVDPYILSYAIMTAEKCKTILQQVKMDAENVFSNVFYQVTVQEWIGDKVTPLMKDVENALAEGQLLQKLILERNTSSPTTGVVATQPPKNSKEDITGTEKDNLSVVSKPPSSEALHDVSVVNTVDLHSTKLTKVLKKKKTETKIYESLDLVSVIPLQK